MRIRFRPKKQKKRELNPREELSRRFADAAPSMIDTLLAVSQFTMTSPERLLALCDAIEHVCRHEIPGSIVECGVWRGGSMMAAARTLIQQGDRTRQLWLYDTYDGMSEPNDADIDFTGSRADQLLSAQDKQDPNSIWCRSPLDEVRQNLASTDYPSEKVRFVAGKVEETIPAQIPEQISLLRLDTDWYESTMHELVHLYPRLCPGGVLIIDDYGHWQGCRRAVNEYFASNNIPIFLNRIDYTGRIAIKPANAETACSAVRRVA